MNRIYFIIVMLLTSATAWADNSGMCGNGVFYTFVESTHTLTISKTGEGTGEINANAFSNRNDIYTVIIESGVTSIGNIAFSGCTNLTSVTIGPDVTSIGQDAFNGCTSLTSVIIGPKVTSIGKEAFKGCTSLTSVAIPYSVTNIGSSAFRHCSNLKKVYVLRNNPNDLTALGDSYVFNGCSTSLKIFVGIGGVYDNYYKSWSSFKDNLYSFGGYCGANGDYVIWVLTDEDGDNTKETLTIAGNGVMKDYSKLEDRPWNNNCDKIQKVIIEPGVTSIGKNAFESCTSLTSVTIPASVTSISDYAFSECSNLKTVYVQRYDANDASPITKLGGGVFGNCHKDLTIYVPPTGFESYINATNLSSYKNIIEPAPDLWIGGKLVTDENAEDVFKGDATNDGKVSYDLKTNTLTLNGASVTGTIESGLGNLTIKLIGSNTIQGNGSSLITSLNGGTLTFDSDGTTVSLLEFKDASGNKFPNNPISGFAEVKYGWFEYVESEGSKKVCSWDIEILKNGTAYRIYDGNKDHILGEGDESVKYSHDATNGHVITLNNAEVNCIWTDIHADITIALNGTNRVIDTGRTYAIYSNNGKINFVKAEGAASVELTATCGNGYVPIEYGSITLGEGLYWKPFYADANATVKSTVITDDPEFIIIENYVMTDDRSIGTATSGITYNSTEKILTFNSYAGDLTSQIKTGVQGLTIKLKGTSTVAASSLDYPFKAMTNTATILFDGENGSETGSLVMDTNSDSAPFEGFAEGAITYNKVVYSRGDGGNNIHTIKAPTAPAMSLDNEKVKLTKDYDDGTIYYSIAYADDTPSETGVKYTEPFAITHPGVVTAWVEANNATTSTVTGKHFAYQDAPYTMAINGTKTPTLLPAIAEGDVISLSGYASADGDIASFIDGLITAKKLGTVTLSAILMPGDNTPFKVLNPVSDPNDPNKHTVSFIVYVGEPLSNYFIGSNEFCTFYNESDKTYAVPQGMKAYVVTGVSGSKLVTVETTVLPPNTVVLLEKGSAISFTKVPSEGAAPGGNLLKHATADISVTTESSLYVLYNDMYVIASPGIIPTGKNYLDLSPTINAGTRGFYTIGEDEATSLREVKSTLRQAQGPSDDAWYLLDGRKLSGQPTKKGIYIYKGKKVKI